jgi:hypothetical protein
MEAAFAEADDNTETKAQKEIYQGLNRFKFLRIQRI